MNAPSSSHTPPHSPEQPEPSTALNLEWELFDSKSTTTPNIHALPQVFPANDLIQLGEYGFILRNTLRAVSQEQFSKEGAIQPPNRWEELLNSLKQVVHNELRRNFSVAEECALLYEGHFLKGTYDQNHRYLGTILAHESKPPVLVHMTASIDVHRAQIASRKTLTHSLTLARFLWPEINGFSIAIELCHLVNRIPVSERDKRPLAELASVIRDASNQQGQIPCVALCGMELLETRYARGKEREQFLQDLNIEYASTLRQSLKPPRN